MRLLLLSSMRLLLLSSMRLLLLSMRLLLLSSMRLLLSLTRLLMLMWLYSLIPGTARTSRWAFEYDAAAAPLDEGIAARAATRLRAWKIMFRRRSIRWLMGTDIDSWWPWWGLLCMRPATLWIIRDAILLIRIASLLSSGSGSGSDSGSAWAAPA